MRLPLRAVSEIDGVPPLVIVDADGVTIADCMVVGTPDEECEANARAIVEAVNAAGKIQRFDRTAWVRSSRVGGQAGEPAPEASGEAMGSENGADPGPSTRFYHPGGPL